MDELIKKMDKKKMAIGIIVFIVIIVCLIGGSLLYYNLFAKKNFQEIETIMTNAAKEYYNYHQKELPTNSGESKSISISDLVASEYMKTTEEYLKDENIICKGSVNVTNVNGNFRYVPLLDCGKDYSYKMLVDYIKENESVVTYSDGLYNINDTLVFKGEKINNYVKFAGTTWRIIKITENKIMLVYNDKGPRNCWDDRYNTSKKLNIGINDYTVSRIRDALNNLYTTDNMFGSKDKLLLSSFNLSIGKVGENEDDKNGEIGKSSILENQYIGLPSITDYMNASLDSNCNYASNPACANYNFLADYEYNFWLLTGDKNTSYNVYQVSSNAGAYLVKSNSNGYIRPVIMITDDAIYTGGKGTLEKPYTFK